MKKRFLSLLLAALLALSVPVASAEMYHLTAERIREMVRHMTEMATGDYLTIKGVPEDLQQAARSWAGGIDGESCLIVRADVQNAAMMVNVRGQFITEPDVVRLEMESTALIEIVSCLVYAASGEADVTGADYERIMEVNSLVNASMQFAQAGADGGYDLFIVLNEGATPLFIVAYYENDTVSMHGWFVPSRRLANCKNVGQISMWLMLNGFTMTCEEFPIT